MQSAKPSRAHRKFVTRTASILLRAKALILSDSDSDDHSLQSSESSGRPCRVARKKLKHGRRVKSVGDTCPTGLSSSYDQSAAGHATATTTTPLYGKRKRCSTLTFTTSGEHSSLPCRSSVSSRAAAAAADGHLKMDTSCSPCGRSCFADCMELDQEDTSSLSDTSVECGSRNYDEADDEQSDFHEVLEKSKHLSSPRDESSSAPVAPAAAATSCVPRVPRSSRIRSTPVLRNPFAAITASTSDRMERSSSIGSSSLWKKRRRSLLPEKTLTSV